MFGTIASAGIWFGGVEPSGYIINDIYTSDLRSLWTEEYSAWADDSMEWDASGYIYLSHDQLADWRFPIYSRNGVTLTNGFFVEAYCQYDAGGNNHIALQINHDTNREAFEIRWVFDDIGIRKHYLTDSETVLAHATLSNHTNAFWIRVERTSGNVINVYVDGDLKVTYTLNSTDMTDVDGTSVGVKLASNDYTEVMKLYKFRVGLL
jgi:hypothetical protein